MGKSGKPGRGSRGQPPHNPRPFEPILTNAGARRRPRAPPRASRACARVPAKIMPRTHSAAPCTARARPSCDAGRAARTCRIRLARALTRLWPFALALRLARLPGLARGAGAAGSEAPRAMGSEAPRASVCAQSRSARAAMAAAKRRVYACRRRCMSLFLLVPRAPAIATPVVSLPLPLPPPCSPCASAPPRRRLLLAQRCTALLAMLAPRRRATAPSRGIARAALNSPNNSPRATWCRAGGAQ